MVQYLHFRILEFPLIYNLIIYIYTHHLVNLASAFEVRMPRKDGRTPQRLKHIKNTQSKLRPEQRPKWTESLAWIDTVHHGWSHLGLSKT